MLELIVRSASKVLTVCYFNSLIVTFYVFVRCLFNFMRIFLYLITQLLRTCLSSRILFACVHMECGSCLLLLSRKSLKA